MVSKLIIIVLCNIFFSFLSISITAESNSSSIDWCSLPCTRGRENVGCTYKENNCALKEPCVLDTTLDKVNMLHLHNEFRNKFASGGEKNYEAITASNMLVLQWDDDLEYLAGCNLAPCHGMKHDKCRRTPKFDLGGQNLFASSSGSTDCTKFTTAAVQVWFNEIRKTTPQRLAQWTKSFKRQQGVGHLSQLAWASATHVGCAVSKKTEGDKTECILACDYGPAGNFDGASMYKHGRPCSKCPENVGCSSKYTSLCRGSSFLHPSMGVLIISFFVQAYLLIAK